MIDMSNEIFEEVFEALLKAADRLNFAELFAGLGGSPLIEFLGEGGWGGAAKKRGHNVQAYELDPSLKQGDPNYHIRDVMDMDAEEIMDDFDWEGIDAGVASFPCKAFTTASGNKGWIWDRSVFRFDRKGLG
jgi:site-specific DNA-cytosine methylase